MKSTVVAPAGTVTVAGTVARVGLFETRLTLVPPVAAGAFSVSVAIAPLVDPPATAIGFTVIPVTFRMTTWVIAVADAPLAAAITVTPVSEVTAPAVAAKVVESVPAGTVTVAGTVSAGLELLSETTVPAAGAVVESVTVPVAEVPDPIVAGSVTDLTPLVMMESADVKVFFCPSGFVIVKSKLPVAEASTTAVTLTWEAETNVTFDTVTPFALKLAASRPVNPAPGSKKPAPVLVSPVTVRSSVAP